jgi:hypothetical protein
VKVIDVLKSALVFADRTDILPVLEGTAEATEEQQYVLDVMLYCYNAVEDELARTALPLVRVQSFETNGTVNYTSFLRAPVRILRVAQNGKSVRCEQYATYLKTCEGVVEITYRYAPNRKSLQDDCEIAPCALGEELPAFGVLAEYCLVAGEEEEADRWQKKYEESIALLKHSAGATLHNRVRARRWI